MVGAADCMSLLVEGRMILLPWPWTLLVLAVLAPSMTLLWWRV